MYRRSEYWISNQIFLNPTIFLLAVQVKKEGEKIIYFVSSMLKLKFSYIWEILRFLDNINRPWEWDRVRKIYKFFGVDTLPLNVGCLQQKVGCPQQE